MLMLLRDSNSRKMAYIRDLDKRDKLTRTRPKIYMFDYIDLYVSRHIAGLYPRTNYTITDVKIVLARQLLDGYFSLNHIDKYITDLKLIQFKERLVADHTKRR